MKTLICIAACLFSVTCFGQTKLVSYRSHSGNNANFRTAVENNLFDIGNSNIGLSVEHVDKVDSVIFKSNDKIIVLRKTYDIVVGMGRGPAKITYVRDVLTKATAADFFKANSIDSLKAEIHKMYKTTKTDSTLFIGFDKKFKQKKA
jgi:hypothetical protein